jgi:hypothetical protein
MSATSSGVKLVFAREFSEREAMEARDRGYLSHVLVELDGHLYPVVFYDPIRLQQDLELNVKHGRTFVADPGMIVITDITIEAMQEAIQRLSQEGYFNYLTPLNQDCLSSADQYSWPPGYSHQSG